MANKKPFQYVRTTKETVSIKGVLDESCEFITYIDNKSNLEKKANIKDYLEKFAGEEIEFNVGFKRNIDLLADEE